MNFSIGSFSFLANKKQTTSEPLKLLYTDPETVRLLSDRLRFIFTNVASSRPVVILCVGTDRSTGDALGPLVGTSLSQTSEIPVYGTLDEPVHAMNLSERLEQIHSTYGSPFILAVDACLSQLSSVGTIQIAEGPVKPGAGVNKELPPVGDFHVTGIVNVGGFMEYFVLQNTRLSLVFNMAQVIAEAIRTAANERSSSITSSASPD